MSDAAAAGPRVVLVETSDALPGLLPFQAWDAIAVADEVLVRDPERHPSAPHLYAAGLDLAKVEPATLDRGDLDLTRPGAPEDRRMAKALLQRALDGATPVYLLDPTEDGLAPALAGMAAEHDLEIELVFLAPLPEGTELLRLVEVMRRLRDPEDGCPWDLQQDHQSLLGYLLEETYELVEAVEEGTDQDLVEELGDLLLQIVFHARVAQDRDAFGVDDVARGIADKLVRRHPHVFADGEAETAEDVQTNWDALKAEEKGRTGPFDGVPDAMAGLMLLDTLQRKADKRALRAPGDADERLRAAVRRLEERADDRAVGELLAAAVAVARRHGVDPEGAARESARRFRRRAEVVAELAGRRGLDLDSADPAEIAALWEEAEAQDPSEGNDVADDRR